MKIFKTQLALLAILVAFSCKEVKKEASDAKEEVEELMDEAKTEMNEEETVVKFMLEPKSDSKVKGEVTFTEDDDEVSMVAVLSGLTEG
ncbi:MAG: superoxide dismutase family protein, partial [Maribacter stanieri]